MQYDKNKFLLTVRAKIRRKKKIKNVQYTSFIFVSIIIISFVTTNLIYQSTMENLWTENNTISYYYEWDRIPDVDQDEMFEFLVDEMDVYDLNLLLSDEFITQITLKNQKMKG